ncbi:MAG TPA: twin-arginine translocase TatA/TatE family subunit [Actinomycetota bacterium]|jgi:sec-independent protein translocase protein TatA
MMPGIEELLVILLIVLVIFGGAKLPQLARSLGKAKGEFHKGLKEGDAGEAGQAKDQAKDHTKAEDTPAG